MGGRRPAWRVWVLGAVVVGVAVAVPAIVVSRHHPRPLPTRPLGWHAQADALDGPILGVDDRSQIFPVGSEPDFDPAAGAVIGAPGSLAGPDYQFQLIGSWAVPKVDTHAAFQDWRGVQDAVAAPGDEILIVALRWTVPPAAPTQTPKLPAGAVTVVDGTTRYPVEPVLGDVIEAAVHQGGPVSLEVRDQGHVNRLELRTGTASGDLPQRVKIDTAQVDLHLPWTGTASAVGAPVQCRVSGTLTVRAAVSLVPSSAADPGPPGRAHVYVLLPLKPSGTGKALTIAEAIDCGESSLAGVPFPNQATVGTTFALGTSLAIRDAGGKLVHATAGDTFTCRFIASQFLTGCPDAQVAVQNTSVGAVFDVPATTTVSKLVFTPRLTMTDATVSAPAYGGNLPLGSFVPGPSTEIPVTLR